MIKKTLSALLFAGLIVASLQAQSEEPILFSVEDQNISLSEFEYIYGKTGGDGASYDEASLREYLDLYINFKLKVRKAREMGLDTIPSLNQELAGYRRQLADSYLIDREVTDKLTEEAYERRKEDVDMSHILIKIPRNADQAAMDAALKKAEMGLKRIQDGATFEEVAVEISDDPGAKTNKGRIGFVTALFPSGFYELETAAYTTPVGEVSGPYRTPSGYHLVKVHEKRPAYGEIEVAHILIRKQRGQAPAPVKSKIDSIYGLLQAGEDFDQLAIALSEDRRTAGNKGYLGFFGIKRYELPFETAAFALEEDGEISEPVETSVGWHIIKRISRKGIQPFEIDKRRLKEGIKRDARYSEAQDALVEKIKGEGSYVVLDIVLNEFAESLPDSFLTYRWKPNEEGNSKTLFRLGDGTASLGDFKDYLARASRQRISYAGKNSPEVAARELYESFLRDYCLKYEEGRLEEKYPEFKALMREYEEGILLFEAARILVWDKAAQDTIGLEAFYEEIREEGRYRWGERLRLMKLSASKNKVSILEEKIKPMLASGGTEEALLESFDSLGLEVSELYIEEQELTNYPGLKWEEGSLSEVRITNGQAELFRVEEMVSPRDKELNEARGYIIADYQDLLEKEWIEQLRKEYDVDVNEDVFRSLIGKKKPAQPE